MTTYSEVLKEFKKLPHVDDDQLDGTVSHLVYRVQHELDILAEGEWNDDLPFTAREEEKLRSFIVRHGTTDEVSRMDRETPKSRTAAARKVLQPAWKANR